MSSYRAPAYRPEYEKQRIIATRCLFHDILWSNFPTLTTQQRNLCHYITNYLTYQKRMATDALFTGRAKSSCIDYMHKYITMAEKDSEKTLLQHLRSDSLLILKMMKKFGAESREFDMLGEMFVALFKREVVLLDLFSQREVDVTFWIDVEVQNNRSKGE